jgi:hypothetical protein
MRTIMEKKKCHKEGKKKGQRLYLQTNAREGKKDRDESKCG